MPSRRATAIGFAAALAIGLAALLAGGLATRSKLVNTTGVLPVYPIAPLRMGDEACQSPIGLGDEVERVRFNIGTFGKPGPPLSVTIRDPDSQRVLGSGDVPPGWVDNGTPQEVPIGSVPEGLRVSVCVRNDGPTKAYLYGNYYNGRTANGPITLTPTITTSSATVDGFEIAGDVSLAFVSSESRSLLTRLPSAFRHASVFRPSFVGSWTFWLLFALLVLAVPAALWRALTIAGSAEDETRRYSDPAS
ncbi:MAG: hypothetical protein QOJ57_221 [Thermoleophilaceae bacterium]|jgi:hypothetical protein|nr:hypothetical protein [Thermoleophilaceae bacterium]